MVYGEDKGGSSQLKTKNKRKGQNGGKGGKRSKSNWGPSSGPKGTVQVILGDSHQEVAIKTVMVVMGGANTSGEKGSKPNKQGKVPKGNQGRNPSNLLLVWRKAHREELSSVTCSAIGDKEVGKGETWTPQPMMCGIQVNVGGSSLGDNTGPENERKFTELVDQLKVQCLRETTVIPQ